VTSATDGEEKEAPQIKEGQKVNEDRPLQK
jgi:hypothetical protein